MISRPNRNLFWNVVKKYKRNFHPSNASKGESNTSDVPSLKTPRRIREMKERYKREKEETEMKRMAVLSRVINENNRRAVKQRREKNNSISRFN